MADDPEARRERSELLGQIEDWLETPMLVLGLIWLMLVVADLVWGVAGIAAALTEAIWIVFILDFLLRLLLAPDKAAFLRGNVLTMLSLAVPALRLFRVTRLLLLARAARGVRLVRVVGSINRGVRSLRHGLGRRRLGYVMAVTVLVVIAGGAGMYSLEAEAGTRGFATYGDSLWWTAMIITSLGSEAWPATAEGRVLCLLLSIYGFAVFGYVTGSFASFFVGQDALGQRGSADGQLEALRGELAALRQELARRA